MLLFIERHSLYQRKLENVEKERETTNELILRPTHTPAASWEINTCALTEYRWKEMRERERERERDYSEQ